MNLDTRPELDYDLTIIRTTRRGAGGGTWVIGRLDGYRFDALVFPQHAVNPVWEIGHSRISKLGIQRTSDKATVFNWDRGADMEPQDDEVQAVVDFLNGGLADLIYGS